MDLLAALGRLSRHRLLERLIRGRAWIGLVAFALIGIVTLQLALLQLNGGIGRALAREAALQRENAALSVTNSELASSDRVQAQARGLGMEFVSTGALRFLAASPGRDVSSAAPVLATPLRAAGEELSKAGGGQVAEGGHAQTSAGQSSETSEAASSRAASGESATPAGTGTGTGTGGGEERTTSPAPGAGGSEARSEEAPAQTPAASESSSGGGTAAGH
jgi:cell division protein FtsL